MAAIKAVNHNIIVPLYEIESCSPQLIKANRKVLFLTQIWV